MLCFVTVLADVAAVADADAPLRDVLAAALEANERLARLADELRAENARLREALAQRDAELEQAMAALAVLQRMVFGRSSERSQPDAADRAGAGDGDGGPGGGRAGLPGNVESRLLVCMVGTDREPSPKWPPCGARTRGFKILGE